jgi:hypothetical protein
VPITKSILKKIGLLNTVDVTFEISDNHNVKHDPLQEAGYILEMDGNREHKDLQSWIETYYSMIFKRKSFHIFRGQHILRFDELQRIKVFLEQINPLVYGIKTAIRIVPREQTNCPRGEYCILFYSELKEHYLENIGYMGEQLDLWLANNSIGACWYGMGKTEEQSYHGLSFVIMIAI